MSYDQGYLDGVRDAKARLAMAIENAKRVGELEAVVASYAMTERELKAELAGLRAALEEIADPTRNEGNRCYMASRALEEK